MTQGTCLEPGAPGRGHTALWLMLLWLLWLPSAAAAGPGMPALEFVAEPAVRLGIDQVRALPAEQWRAARGVPNFGFSGDAYWLRLRVEPAAEQQLLEVGYPLLDDLQLYVFSGTRRLAAHGAGRQRPFAERPLPHRNFLFPLPVVADAPLTVYLRVESGSTLQVPLRLWTPAQLAAAEQGAMLMHGVYFGVVGLMILLNLFLAVLLRSRDHLYYVGLVTALCLLIASLSGLGFQFLWPRAVTWNTLAPPLFAGLSIVFVCLFSSRILRLDQDRPRLLRALRLLAGGGLAVSLAPFWLQPRPALALAVAAGLAASLAVLVVAISVASRARPEARYFVYAWSAMGVGALLIVLNKFGLLGHSGVTEYGLQLASGLEAVLLALMLARRQLVERSARLQAQARALEHERLARETHGRLLAAQVAARETLERRVLERTRQLEEVLHRLAEANRQLKDLSYIDPLTEIGNRRLFDQRYRQEWQRAFRERAELALILIDIDGFKRLNDTYGHPAGDACLRTVAGILANTVSRPSDCVSRFGGEEFAVIMPQTSVEGAQHLAETIRAAVQRSVVRCQGHTVRLTVSAGVAALVPGERNHQAILLSFADDALYRAKREGRNRVCAYQLSLRRDRPDRAGCALLGPAADAEAADLASAER